MDRSKNINPNTGQRSNISFDTTTSFESSSSIIINTIDDDEITFTTLDITHDNIGTSYIKYALIDECSTISTIDAISAWCWKALPPVISDKQFRLLEKERYILNIFDGTYTAIEISTSGLGRGEIVSPTWDTTPEYITPDGNTVNNINEFWIVPGSVSISNGTVVNTGDQTITFDTGTFSGTGASQPFTITYSIDNGCKVTTKTINGVLYPENITTFVFDFDYLVVSYNFSDGNDLDIRVRMVEPDIGQTTNNYIGWGMNDSFSTGGKTILRWGGDNTGTGFESVIVNLADLLAAKPGISSMILDFRGNWYASVGTQPVVMDVKLYKGGTPRLAGFLWTVDSPTNSQINITSQRRPLLQPGGPNKNPSTDGNRIASLSYNINTLEGIINATDTILPAPAPTLPTPTGPIISTTLFNTTPTASSIEVNLNQWYDLRTAITANINRTTVTPTAVAANNLTEIGSNNWAITFNNPAIDTYNTITVFVTQNGIAQTYNQALPTLVVVSRLNSTTFTSSTSSIAALIESIPAPTQVQFIDTLGNYLATSIASAGGNTSTCQATVTSVGNHQVSQVKATISGVVQTYTLPTILMFTI